MTDRDLVSELAAARLAGNRTVVRPDDLDLDQARVIQDRATTACGLRTMGYKIGATSAEAQRLLSAQSPFYGPLFAEDRFEPGSRLRVGETVIGLECEFAFRMAQPFPSTEDPGDIEALKDAIDVCAPAFEIVGTRFAGEGLPTAAQCVSDFGLNVAFCTGPEWSDWRETDLSAIEVTADIDGVRAAAGTGANVLGNPLQALSWLAAVLVGEGRRLEQGDWISTGTCLGIVSVRPGSNLTADYGPAGRMSLSFD